MHVATNILRIENHGRLMTFTVGNNMRYDKPRGVLRTMFRTSLDEPFTPL